MKHDAGLVTEKNEASGHYAPANRWRRPLVALSPLVAERVNACLSDFARRVDHLIDEVKQSWVVVSLEDGAPGYFRFPIERNLLSVARSAFKPGSSFDHLVSALLQHLHATLEQCLAEIRTAFAVTLAARANDLIASLHLSLDEVEFPASLSEVLAALRAAIDSAAGEWHHDILEASEWFALARRAGGSTFTAADAVHIAESTLARTGRRFHLVLTDDADGCDFPANSETSLVDIFELLFDNAYRRSGFLEGTTCDVRLSRNGRRIRIEMSNIVAETVDDGEIHSRVEQLTLELESEEIVRRASVDTRSGYPKICNILRNDLSWDHALALSYDTNARLFKVVLELEVPA